MAHLVDRKFGAYYPLSTSVVNGAYQYNFDYLESQVGRKFDVYSAFLEFGSDYPGNPTPPGTRKQHSDVSTAAADGHDILIGLAPIVSYQLGSDGAYHPQYATFADIRSGTYDTKLTNLFTWLLGLGVNVTVRFAWEMNLSSSAWYPNSAASSTWQSGKILTTTGIPVTTSAADFISGWQYLTNLLRSLPNASLLKMYYCPGAQDQSAGITNGYTVSSMYPGTAYTDVVGYDIYNSLGNSYHTPLDILRGIRENDNTNPYAYDILTTLHGMAEVWVGETGCVDLNDSLDTTHLANGHSKAQWFSDFFAIADDLPRLTTVNFFDSKGTRKTWPFDSSSDALAGFVQAFNFDSDSVQHGTVAPAYTPPAGTPAYNPSGIGLPLPANHIIGDSGRTAFINALEYYVNQIATSVNGWTALTSNTDGSVPALNMTANSVGDAFNPVIQIKTPGGTNKEVFGTKVGPSATYNSFRIRDDGRLEFGPGGSAGDIDIKLYRSGSATLSTDGSLTVGTNLTVNGTTSLTGSVSPSSVLLSDISTPSSPAVGAGAVLYAQNDGIYFRNSGVITPLMGEQARLVADDVYPYDPVLANAGTVLTSGVIYLVKVRVFRSRSATRINTNIITAGATLTASQCFAGIYDVNGNLVVATADMSTTWTSTGFKAMTIATTTIDPGDYYLGLLSNGTTNPAIARFSSNSLNYNSSGGSSTRFGKYGTSQTSLPSTITTASIIIDSDAKLITLH